MNRLGVTLAISLLSSTAHAGFFNGNELYKNCTQSGSNSFMTGYVSGWVDKWQYDAYQVQQAAKGKNTQSAADLMVEMVFLGIAIDKGICMPENATAGQVADVFCKFLQDNPAQRADSGNILLSKALAGSFSCSK
ncbi:Rap1a/Tai family immunity protein [Rhizobium bangladeshense]|uniref:Rap1a/Tai family immunity protein n=1 Tax=Rhizobium bangladeshense TaxID=1138189 RepID=UPI001C838D20|nr:Rap1a/Tai family immunity protein [Rhizobium bangladeshense]MBX4895915.1 hypothetical protein [Rhizobium bangladeshense]MBY3613049.1 hypothetical protein [Rhizobium bangladeshense]